MRQWVWLVLIYLMKSSLQFTEENGIVGDPEVDCGEGHITISFETFSPFKGLVFVRGHAEAPECRSPPPDEDWHRNSSLRIKLTDCETERRISSDPPGMFVSTTAVIAFHAEFLTKFDRIYHVQCYYMAMKQRLLKEIKINMPGPVMQTEVVPMPVCKYQVLDGTPFGPPVYYAKIGQMVYHKWTCETETTDTFCMVVHSCTVDDGSGNKVELLDKQGCAHDKYLLQNLEYTSDLMAGKEAHVYKYADKDGIFFECQISLTIKEPGQELCPVPVCPDPPRRRRSHPVDSHEQTHYHMDVLNSSSSVDFVMAASEFDSWLDVFDEDNHACVGDLATWMFILLNTAIVAGSILVSRSSLVSLSTPVK